jgi:hypothetical protein
MSEVLQNLETARKILRLPPTDDFHQLSLDVAARVDAMNTVDRAAFHMELGRLTRERSLRTSGEKYAITTDMLVGIAIFFTDNLCHFNLCHFGHENLEGYQACNWSF